MLDTVGQVALTLEHAGEALEVGLQPVLLGVLARRLAQVADHLVELVLQHGDLAAASTPTCRVRSPSVTAVATSAMARTWLVRLAASWLTLSVRSFQTPRDLGGLGLASELALDADLAGHARHLRGEAVELIDHRVDGVLQLAGTRP